MAANTKGKKARLAEDGKSRRVFVGLSGGVDSAVSAALLQAQGHDVTGVFIRIALPGYPCAAGEDKISAMRVAAHLQIPFMVVDLSKEYEREVFNATIAEFKKGKTPNPDTLCNKQIKFGHFWEFAKAQGADCIATGHYARVGSGKLCAGFDSDKDQSYFLWMVPGEVLAHTLFPVGDKTKQEVRALAQKFRLPNAARPDSQGLCFLGDISIEDMLVREVGVRPGDVLDENGNSIGTHRGAALYTLGQRHGFELHAHTPNLPPHYVIAKNIEANTITVSVSKVPHDARTTDLELTNTNWIGAITAGSYEARFRYRQKLVDAELSNVTAHSACVSLDEGFFVPEGQSLVLYQGEKCVGGGIIARAAVR